MIAQVKLGLKSCCQAVVHILNSSSNVWLKQNVTEFLLFLVTCNIISISCSSFSFLRLGPHLLLMIFRTRCFHSEMLKINNLTVFFYSRHVNLLSR